MNPEEEQEILQKSLNKALDEAWEKSNEVLNDPNPSSEEYERKVWAAAESAEYASLLFSLTHDLEDLDPSLPNRRMTETQTLVKESVEALKLAKSLPLKRKIEGYTNLRIAVQCLRNAYSGLTSNPRKTRQSLTRS